MMTEIAPNLWNGWTIILTALGFVGLGWAALSIHFFLADPPRGDDDAAWKSAASESSSPILRWWFWMVLAATVLIELYLLL